MLIEPRFAPCQVLLLLVCLLSCSPLAVAQGGANLVLQNVTIPDSESGEGDQVVNIVIRDGVLDLVAQQGAPVEASLRHYDAESGVLLGNLVVGQPASFLVIEGDPRTNIEALLDTKRWATFAISEGSIRRNRLAARRQPEARQGWFAYNPPPVALATDYRTRQKWNYYNSRHVRNLLTGTVALDRTFWLDQDSANREQVGDLDANEGGSIRALRLGLVGRLELLDTPLSYTIFGATSAFDKGFDARNENSFVWFDYRADIPLGATTISIGKQKEPVSMERLMPLLYIPFQERSSPNDTFMRSRNIGVVASGELPGNRAAWAAGIFNDWLEDDGGRGDNDTQYMGRITGVPLQTADASHLLHLGLSYRTGSGDEGLRTGNQAEVDSGPNFIETGVIPADRVETYQYEASWRRGPLWLHSEYIDTRLSDTPHGDLRLGGYNLSGSWIMTGEMRDYDTRNGTFRSINVARPVNHNGWGALELGLRFSHTDLADGPVQGGEMDIWTLGVNWWLRNDLMTSINWRTVDLDRAAGEPLMPLTGEATGLTLRLMMILD